MSPERWRAIDRLFAASLALPECDRAVFLEKECGNDGKLRRQVESLLAHAGQSADLDAVVQEAAGRLSEEEAEGLIGRRAGAYRITSVVGRGGMGIVCAAVRDDAQFAKQVAVKLIRRGMDTADLVRRFRAERQILAGLEHPGIARLIDGGSTGDGQLYFVMEYVDGTPVTAYCEERGLSVAARVRLFLKVCEAVRYAHRNLVVHQDLKPGNVLVTPEGEPKLLDFGLARMLRPSEDLPAAMTGFAPKLLTPDYASPEQVQGGRITTATDVYSLGAVLYEMLTGGRPHRLRDYTPLEIEQAVCATKVERPSSAAVRLKRSKRLARELRGDLDNIILKAMHKEPERRYDGVESLAQDLARFLDGRPVAARPDSALYRLKKFALRNRLSVAAAALAAASLIAGMAAAAWQAQRAERRFEQVRGLAHVFLFDLHDRLRQLPGALDTRRFVVRTGLEYLASLEREAGGDAELMVELARGYLQVGDVQGNPLESNLGDPAGAMSSYQKAVALLERARTARRRNRPADLTLSAAYTRMGALVADRGDREAALNAYRSALRIGEALAAQADDPEALGMMSRAHNGIARILNDQNDLEGVTEHAAASVALARNLVEKNPDDQEIQVMLSTGHRFLGTALERPAGEAKAFPHYLASVRIREKLSARSPLNPEAKRHLMLAYSQVGDYWRTRRGSESNLENALGYFRKMLEIAEWLAAQDPQDRRARVDLSHSLLRTGALLADLSRTRESLVYLQRCAALIAGLRADGAANHAMLFNEAFVQERLAHAYTAERRLDRALAHSRAGAAAVESLLAARSGQTDVLHQALANNRTHARVLGLAGDRAGLDQTASRIAGLAALAAQERWNALRRHGVAEAFGATGDGYEALARQAMDQDARAEAWTQARLWYRRGLEACQNAEASGGAGDSLDAVRARIERRLAAAEAQAARPAEKP